MGLNSAALSLNLKLEIILEYLGFEVNIQFSARRKINMYTIILVF